MAPNELTIKITLRELVRTLPEGFTVNDVRTAAEEKLDLNEGFLKSGQWKAKSKIIITEALDEDPASQKSPPSSPPRKAPTPKAKPAPKKRASDKPAPKARKRQKRDSSESESAESELLDLSSSEEVEEDDDYDSEKEEELPKPTKKQPPKPKQPSVHSESEAEPDAVSIPRSSDKKTAEEAKVKEDSESELSDVIDEPPPKKRRQKSAGAEGKAKAKPAKAKKASAAPAKDVSPDEAEIKRLQGWLVKCGIRKLWHKELAPCDSPKAKIKHLKDMLKDAGMDGRYSVEKANAIKEQRELAADLEAVQEGAKIWGNEADEGSDGEEAFAEVKPRRRAAAAARFVDFGDSGEDSD